MNGVELFGRNANRLLADLVCSFSSLALAEVVGVAVGAGADPSLLDAEGMVALAYQVEA